MGVDAKRGPEGGKRAKKGARTLKGALSPEEEEALLGGRVWSSGQRAAPEKAPAKGRPKEPRRRHPEGS